MRLGAVLLLGGLLLQVSASGVLAQEFESTGGQPAASHADLQRLRHAHAAVEAPKGGGDDHLRLSWKPKPILPDSQLPGRNPPIFEWNEPFLGAGNIKPGFLSPTGAIWQPAFWVFGDFFAGIGHYDNGRAPARTYGATRLDIFGHLQLTPTERVLIGFRPLTRGNQHTGVLHVEGQGTQFSNGFNANPETFFFEGDTRQLFPGIDPNDRRGLDFGFAIGRQPIFFQEGIMVDAPLNSLGITKDTIQIPGLTQDLRITGVAAVGGFRRGDNLGDDSASLFGIFTETDFRRNIVTFDAAYVSSNSIRGGDGVFFGASSTQRFGEINTAFRINTSTALENRGTAVDNGVLLFAEVSRNAPASTNIIYANFFQAIGNYTSAARGALAGGPLNRVGFLFATPAVALAPSPLSGQAYNVFGGAVGYQMFFDANRTQLTFELGGRKDTNNTNQGAIAFGAQYVKAVTSRTSIQVNSFISAGEQRHVGGGIMLETRTRL